MGARLRRSGKAGAVAFLIAIALIGSAWLAFATTAPNGPSNGYGTTTTTAKHTTTTMSTTTTTMCKPGNGYGDKNHCHSGPPGHCPGDHNGNGKNNLWGHGGDKNHCPPPPCKPNHDNVLSFGSKNGGGNNCPPPCTPAQGKGYSGKNSDKNGNRCDK